MMADIKILFTAENVRSIIDDLKWHTRRLLSMKRNITAPHIKRDDWKYFDFDNAWVDAGPSPAGNPGPYLQVPWNNGDESIIVRLYPRIQPDDVLWVGETWAPKTDGGYIYRATDNPEPDCGTPLKWQSSMLMPRAVCRLELKVKRVRIERLRGITEDDAMAEGIGEFGEWGGNEDVTTPVGGFKELWDSIHSNDDNNWDINPWVNVIEFEKAEVK